MKIRNPITGKMEDTSKAKVLPSEEVKIMKPPKIFHFVISIEQKEILIVKYDLRT